MLVVLADELDYLFTRNQQVIYKLFDWPNQPQSQLIVIVRNSIRNNKLNNNYNHRVFQIQLICLRELCHCEISVDYR